MFGGMSLTVVVRSETYGPFTACYPQDSWKKLPHDDRARRMARQGFAFLTSEAARVVYPPKDGEPLDTELKDVPADGKTVGEIVMRGNIAMKEVRELGSSVVKLMAYLVGYLVLQGPRRHCQGLPRWTLRFGRSCGYAS